MRHRSPAGPALFLVALLSLAPFTPIGVSLADAAEPYTLATTASYAVQVDERKVAVTISARFTNLTPDPPGEFSVFTEVPIAVHDAATDVAGRDGEGKLDVAVKEQKGGDGQPVNVATVELRKPLRLKKSVDFTLTYALPDGKDPAVRVRPSLVTFPVWSFGTSSAVRVEIPSVYEVRSDGDPLTATGKGDTTTLSSGAIPNPARWLAVLVADRQTSMTTASRTVPLDGGTVDLNVRSWADDEAWGTRTLELLAKALPLLQEHIGLPYAGVGPLVVTEALPSGVPSMGEPESGVQELQIAYNEPSFTILHQAAHVWIGEDLAGDRWIREGLASHYAALVARELKVEPPYDPVKQITAQQDAAFPLEEWTDDAAPDRAAYGYPASWAFVDRLVSALGEDGLQAVLQRARQGIGAYDPGPAAAGEAATAEAATPLGSRGLLDQAATVGTAETVDAAELDEAFRTTVFGDASQALLTQRSPARADYEQLLAAADDWGAPQPVREAMAEWRFDEATGEIAAARSWLADRDDLLQEIEDAGLSTPERLRAPYESSGGGSDAQVELRAERAVVDDYRRALERSTAGHSFIERIGLIGGSSPDELLASAHGLFADGDLRGAADATSQARARLDAANTAGLLRLASAVLIVLVALGVVAYLLRRRRTLPRNVD